MQGSLPDDIEKILDGALNLTAEEERALFSRMHDGDGDARERLLLSQFRSVVWMARRYRRRGCTLPDLIQEGVVGLLEAINRFNPDRGLRLSTFATWWIRASIQDYVIRSCSIVRVATTPRHRAMFFSCLPGEEEGDSGEPVGHWLAQRFQTTIEDVRAFSARMRHTDQSLDTGSVPGRQACEALPDRTSDPEHQLASRRTRADLIRWLRETLPGLTKRERHVLRRRFVSGQRESFAKIADDLSLSRERVRQVEAELLRKLRSRVDLLPDHDLRGGEFTEMFSRG